MNYATIKKTDVANGPGIRVSLFVSGCTHHCPECFNAEAWDFSYGQPYTLKTQEEILAALAPGYIRGISLLGGEPFEDGNRPVVRALLEEVRKRYPDKDVWCYTGYTFDEDFPKWMEEGREDVLPLLKLIDVLVDGEFVAALKNLKIPFRGSENQRIIDVPASLASGSTVLVERYRLKS